MDIKVKRTDGKIFTNNMSERESIIEIHFCTSYTQVIVQEESEDGKLMTKDIICDAVGGSLDALDLIAIQCDDTGEFIK